MMGGRQSGMSNRSGARTPVSEEGSADGDAKVPPAKLLERRLSETSDRSEVGAERGSVAER